MFKIFEILFYCIPLLFVLTIPLSLGLEIHKRNKRIHRDYEEKFGLDALSDKRKYRQFRKDWIWSNTGY